MGSYWLLDILTMIRDRIVFAVFHDAEFLVQFLVGKSPLVGILHIGCTSIYGLRGRVILGVGVSVGVSVDLGVMASSGHQLNLLHLYACNLNRRVRPSDDLT